ncbi:ribosome small subunit-dependent GTPase A [Phenylobacterium sp.]|uniref:ribosome small subunit-dependent GTPase A n=1 Tax=Phenylobacterium sp. TaxID=1871053 RepID=UPI0030F41949
MIAQYGWSDDLAQAFAAHAQAGHTPARVVAQHRDGYLVATDEGELRANLSGRLHHEAQEAEPPAVGDWVGLALNPADGAATIEAVLPRRTVLTRRAADSLGRLQVIAANIDVVFVVSSMNADLNPRRIERYLAAAWQSGARPVVVLTKSDLCDDPQAAAADIVALADGVPVRLVSAHQGLGLDALLDEVAPGEVCVLIGSSGVGKSTLVNAFLGEDRLSVAEIREADDQGRHTTSSRQLVLLPGGALLLDTPGIREVGLIDAEEAVSEVFDDIESLAGTCRFNDCGHTHEPGCAIQAALQSGALDPGRWANFQKLGRELAAVAQKAERIAKAAERRQSAAQAKTYRTTKRDHRGGAD